MTKQQNRIYAKAGLQKVMLIVFLILAGGCGTKKIPPKPAYDGIMREHVAPLAKQVDDFYRLMLQLDEGQRQFDKYRDEYDRLGHEIKALQQAGNRQPLNENALEVAEEIQTLWVQRRAEHASEKTLSDALIQLNRVDFEDLFQTLLSLESSTQ